MTRGARAERERLDAAHQAEQERELLSATWTAAQAKAGIDVGDLTADQVDVLAEALRIMQKPDPLTADAAGRQLRITRGSNVRTRRILWELDAWIPRGALVLLAGREGLGKSTIACSWCARWTGQGRNVIYVHTEDSREHTVVPRLKAAGADLDRILFVDVATETTETGTVVLPLDNDRLEELVERENVELIILDAATSAMASQLSGKDDRQVRQFLEPLAQLAARRDIVVLGLVHFGKRDGADTGKLILGSIAWSQVARSVLSVAHDEDADHLVLTNTKGNLATRTRSEACRVVSRQVQLDDGPAEVGVIDWLGEVDTDARDVLAGDEQRDGSTTVGEVTLWLTDYLTENAPCPSADVKKAAARLEFSRSSVDRAAKKLGVVSEAKGFPRVTWWSLPSQGTSVVDGEVVTSHTTAPDAPHARQADATDATGSDLHKSGDATESKTQSRQLSLHEATGDAADRPRLHAVPEHPAAEHPKTCREWLDRHIRGLIAEGHTTADSAVIYPLGEAAGWGIQNLRKVASKSPLIAIAEKRTDGVTWAIGEGVQSTYVPCPEWLVGYLGECGGWVPASEVYAAGGERYGRSAIKSAAQAAHILKRGASIATEWSLDPNYSKESA
ncbi:AAA family ATPase [Tsukamurella sputi]|nr:AAA family ATPase [Tsukamurella sputi]